jgi:Calcineurin-like phosphoesterase
MLISARSNFMGKSSRSGGSAHSPRTPRAPTPSSPADEPEFAQPTPTPAPGEFRTPHQSDAAAYKILDKLKQEPLAFPPSRGGTEPVLKLEQVWGSDGPKTADAVTKAGQIVFHAVGDTGNTRSLEPQESVADKMVSDFHDEDSGNRPVFFFHLGDVVYSFGESQYYYDQFYEPYRSYPAPIVAIAGNHDGMVAPGSGATSLEAFLQNFCTDTFTHTADSGGLDRTSMIQPGVYFTFEAPFVRIISVYSNTLEDPGIISTQNGAFPQVTDVQLAYLKAALTRVKTENFPGAVIIALHHPIYTSGTIHGGSPVVLSEIDAICEQTGIWPHAVLSGHAHNYQRYTRKTKSMEIPHLIAGNGGHAVARVMQKKDGGAVRVPTDLPQFAKGGDVVTFENYDDQDYGYLRIIVTKEQLRIEYHPATDGRAAKTPDDHVTVDLKTRKIVYFDVVAPRKRA